VLTVNEIFHSIQGESTHTGRPCVFVRLTACDLRCSWCDTPYAFHEGRKASLDEIVGQVKASAARWSRLPAASRSCSAASIR
jgi:7-carboxy-7-deazaguanine synthase